MDYSGFNRCSWDSRTNETHRKDADSTKQCTTMSSRDKKESELGCSYSALLQLPYFDPVRMHTIDPMHNLFLGSGKHMLSLWIKHDLLSSNHFVEIQAFVDSFIVPSDVGRIPRKIESGFSGFKADQFKNWITIYSIPVYFQHNIWNAGDILYLDVGFCANKGYHVQT